jgi:hypothetical protein
MVLILILVLAQGGRLQDFTRLDRYTRRAPREPAHALSPSEIVSVSGAGGSAQTAPATVPAIVPTTGPGAARAVTVVANFADLAGAKDAYAALSSKVAAGQTLTRFGQTLIVTVAPGDDAARRGWVDALEGRTREVAVDSAELFGATLTLTCVLPSSEAAKELHEELEEYFTVPRQLHLVPPWSPSVPRVQQDWARHRQARRTYVRLHRAAAEAYKDPRLAEINRQISAALRRGEAAQQKELAQKHAKLLDEIRRESARRLLASDASLDPVVAEQFPQLPFNVGEYAGADETGKPADFDAPAYRAMAARMGQLPLAGGKPEAGASRYSAPFGSATHSGSQLRISWMNFEDPSHGAPALAHWLAARGGTSMKYEFRLPSGRED